MVTIARDKPLTDEMLIKYHSLDMSQGEIARLTGRTKQTISTRMKKLGLSRGILQKKQEQVEILEPDESPTTFIPHHQSDLPTLDPDESLLDQLITLRAGIAKATNEVVTSTNEVSTAEGKVKLAAYKDAAQALKTLTTIADSAVAIHNSWAEVVVEAATTMADRIIRRTRQLEGSQQIKPIVAEEFESLKRTVVKHYNESSPSKMK